jgi:hypothetical protein
MSEKNGKPDPLEFDRLLLRAEKAVDDAEKSKLYRQAAEEAQSWGNWHNKKSIDFLNPQEVSDGYF